MKPVAFIFARSGSKGVPGKNTRLFSGKPLIAWSIEQALAVNRFERLIVSTDSSEIAGIARDFGAETPFIRPEELARDDSSEIGAWRHALRYVSESSGSLPEPMVSLPATAPLRTSLDINKCLDEYEKGGADVIITVTDSHRNPFYNMVKKNDDGTVSIVNSTANEIVHRQSAPIVYDITTVCYVANSQFIMSNDSIFGGRVRSVNVPAERSIDIDTLYDFQVAEFLMEMREKKK